MDQDWGKVSVTEEATIKKFDAKGDEITPHVPADLPSGYNLEYARAILIGLQSKHPIFSGVSVDKEKKRAKRRASTAARRASRRS